MQGFWIGVLGKGDGCQDDEEVVETITYQHNNCCDQPLFSKHIFQLLQWTH